MFHERLANPARKYSAGRFHPNLPPGASVRQRLPPLVPQFTHEGKPCHPRPVSGNPRDSQRKSGRWMKRRCRGAGGVPPARICRAHALSVGGTVVLYCGPQTIAVRFRRSEFSIRQGVRRRRFESPSREDVNRPPEWRNWQTRWIQNPVQLTLSVGSSPTSGTSASQTPVREVCSLYGPGARHQRRRRPPTVALFAAPLTRSSWAAWQ